MYEFSIAFKVHWSYTYTLFYIIHSIILHIDLRSSLRDIRKCPRIHFHLLIDLLHRLQNPFTSFRPFLPTSLYSSVVRHTCSMIRDMYLHDSKRQSLAHVHPQVDLFLAINRRFIHAGCFYSRPLTTMNPSFTPSSLGVRHTCMGQL